MPSVFSKTGSTPTPWSRGLRDQIQNGRPKTRNPFISRVFCAQRGSETMISEGPDHEVGGADFTSLLEFRSFTPLTSLTLLFDRLLLNCRFRERCLSLYVGALVERHERNLSMSSRVLCLFESVRQGPLNGGVSNGGGFPIWTCPSFFRGFLNL